MKNTTLLLSVLMILLLGSCNEGDSGEARIAVTYEPQAWLLEQIAGDDVDIVTLIPAGSNPETYEPTLGTMKRLAEVSVYFTLGTSGFEESIVESVKDNFSKLRALDTSIGVDKIFGTHTGATDYGHGFDPHMLTSIRNCNKIAENMARSLSKIYPDKADIYMENYKKLSQRLSKLDKQLIDKNLQGKTIVIRHPQLTYFAKDYGINQITLEKDGKEPTPLQLSAQIEEMKKASPSIVVLDRSGNPLMEKQVAEQLGVKTIDLNLDSKNWIEEIKRLANEID